jgi:hypothetical protein
VGHLDIEGRTHADDLADNLGIDLLPNLDLILDDEAVFNIGLSLGIAGNFKQENLGVRMGLTVGSPRK